MVGEVKRSLPGVSVDSGAAAVALALPGLLAAGVLLAWLADGGGFSTLVWYPGGLFLLALIGVIGGRSEGWSSQRLPARATILLAAFTVWSFLSISWAGVRGDAWDGANRTLVYLLVFLLFAHWRLGSVAVAAIVALLSVGTAVIGIVSVEQAIHSATPLDYFIGSRLVGTTGYPNATAAAFLISFWPALYLGSRRELPALVRGPAFAVAGTLLQLSLIPQSRGAVFSLPIVALAYLAAVPGRARSLAAMAGVAVPTMLILPRLLDVYRTGSHGGDLRQALRTALVAMAVFFVATAVVGYGGALLDRRYRLSERAVDRANKVLAVLGVLAVVVGAGAFAVTLGAPVPRLEAAWRDFKAAPEPVGSSHFGGLGSHRYDFWRVALLEFRSHPWGGVGVDNYAADYLRQRRSNEEPLYPHSLEMRLLGQTGLVGTVLFLAFLAAVLLGVVGRRRMGTGFSAGLAAAAAIAGFYWIVHGSADWLWEMPALGGAAFACLGLAVNPGSGGEAASGPRRRWLLAPAAAAGVAAAVSFAAPWAAARDVAIAETRWPAHRSEAFGLLHQAGQLNPLDDESQVVAGLIAGRTSDDTRAAAFYRSALARNPFDWFASLELALTEARLGRSAQAVTAIAGARRLNPKDGAVALVARSIRVGEPLSQRRLDSLLIGRLADVGVG